MYNNKTSLLRFLDLSYLQTFSPTLVFVRTNPPKSKYDVVNIFGMIDFIYFSEKFKNVQCACTNDSIFIRNAFYSIYDDLHVFMFRGHETTPFILATCIFITFCLSRLVDVFVFL